MLHPLLPSRKGFTLIELLLVMTIFGLALALVIPRAMQAQVAGKMSTARQVGSEVASNIMTWAESQAKTQRALTSFTVKDFLYEDVLEKDGAGLTSYKLVDKYTGNDAYDGVESLSSGNDKPINPFNNANYFAKVNNDTAVPSKKPALLFLAARPDPGAPDYLNFYLLLTSSTPDTTGSFWYGGMSHDDDDKIRRGIFVSRLFDDQEYGGIEPEYVYGAPEEYSMGGSTEGGPGGGGQTSEGGTPGQPGAAPATQ